MHPGISILFVDCWKRCRQIKRPGIPTIPVDSPTQMFRASVEIWKQGPDGICWLVFLYDIQANFLFEFLCFQTAHFNRGKSSVRRVIILKLLFGRCQMMEVVSGMKPRMTSTLLIPMAKSRVMSSRPNCEVMTGQRKTFLRLKFMRDHARKKVSSV